MSNASVKAPNGFDQVPLHPLRVVNVVLQSEVVAVDGIDQRGRLLRCRDEARSVVVDVERLHEDLDSSLARPVRHPGEVPLREIQLLDSIEITHSKADWRVDSRALQPRGKLQRLDGVLPESTLMLRVAEQPAVSTGRITHVEVKE